MLQLGIAHTVDTSNLKPNSSHACQRCKKNMSNIINHLQKTFDIWLCTIWTTKFAQISQRKVQKKIYKLWCFWYRWFISESLNFCLYRISEKYSVFTYDLAFSTVGWISCARYFFKFKFKVLTAVTRHLIGNPGLCIFSIPYSFGSLFVFLGIYVFVFLYLLAPNVVKWTEQPLYSQRSRDRILDSASLYRFLCGQQ